MGLNTLHVKAMNNNNKTQSTNLCFRKCFYLFFAFVSTVSNRFLLVFGSKTKMKRMSD